MSSERIIVDVDDVEVDIAIAKLKQAVTMKSTLSLPGAGGMSNFAAFWERVGKDFSETAREMGNLERRFGFKLKDVPTINREVRFLLNQFPGMRQVQSLWFSIRRGLRGFDIGDAQLALSILVIAIGLLKTVEQRMLRIERLERMTERFIRRQRGITHDQYNDLTTEWQSVFRRRPG